jgi:dUTPase
MVICELPEVELICVDELSESKRGAGGFGSTGKK